FLPPIEGGTDALHVLDHSAIPRRIGEVRPIPADFLETPDLARRGRMEVELRLERKIPDLAGAFEPAQLAVASGFARTGESDPVDRQRDRAILRSGPDMQRHYSRLTSG